jgi:uncharacterized protein (TIGR03435 family)
VIGVLTFALQAQQPPSPSDVHEFDAVSIKPNHSAEEIGRIIVSDGGLLRANNVNAQTLIWLAYGNGRRLLKDLLKGGPGWTETERYDVIAKAANVPQMNLRTAVPFLQRLLAERFQLRVHVEPQQLAIYALTRARPERRGPSLTPTTADCSPASPTRNQCRARFGDGSFDAVGYSMSTVAISLSSLVQQVVTDDTSLQGLFDVSLRWNESGLNADRPSLFTAVEEQWGLKLEPRRAPVDVVVIDEVQRPSPD